MKLLLDEMFSAEIAVQLRQSGSRGISQLVLALDALLRTREGWPTGDSPIHWLR